MKWKELPYNDKINKFTPCYDQLLSKKTPIRGLTMLGDERDKRLSGGAPLITVFDLIYRVSSKARTYKEFMDGMAKTLNNIKLECGFSIKKVLACGNNGTTVLAFDDVQLKDVVLKFYHKRNTVNEGIHEFKLLKKL
jgi:hypothetical protein